jgi:hypothetical protein
MAGLNLNTGLTGSVVGGLYGNGATAPPRTGVPEGPSAAAMAYGAGGASGEANGGAGMHACVIGGIALALLLFMWWGLPR